MIRSSLLCLVGFLISVLALGQERWQDDDYILDSFLKIALEREYKETKHPKLVRWNTPIELYFESDSGDAALQQELLSVHAQHLAHITGLSIGFTKDRSNANIFVVFTTYDNLETKVRQYIGDPDNIRAALDEAICLGSFRHNGQHHITRGTILIPVDYARQRRRFLDCIVEEITQLLGLPNDSDDVFPSIFNDVSVDVFLSPLDYLLLKALYSKHLSAGMDIKQVTDAFPNVLKDLRANDEIDKAAYRVQQHSLKTHLGY